MNSSPIRISIIAPIYGVEKYIVEFAKSILSQDYPNIEFIFVNDGTKDRSIELLEELIDKEYAHLRPQIKIVHKENGGLPAARRTGLDHATGDYIYHVDSDDWLGEGAIKKIAARIDETGADVVYFGFVKEYKKRRSIKHQKEYSIETKEQYIADMYNHHAAAAVWNKCIKRLLYTDNIIYTPCFSYAEDCYITTQLIGRATSIAYLDEILYHYRKDNPNAMTRQQIKRRKRQYAENFIDLYLKYSDVEAEENPISCILDDIVIQCGWYSLLYNFKFFNQHPWLAKAIRKAHIRPSGSNVWVGAQIITKLVALFK